MVARATGLSRQVIVDGMQELREGQRAARTAPPATMVIFGASGDLTRRKLVPALYNLALERSLAPVSNRTAATTWISYSYATTVTMPGGGSLKISQGGGPETAD